MTCCAPGCEHKPGSPFGCHFYNFPSPNDGPDWETWFDIWLFRVNRTNKHGDQQWRPATNTKLCSCHFRAEDQWDPKSRKGGLKCKEPVFFNYNTDVASSSSPLANQQQHDIFHVSKTETEEQSCGNHPDYVASYHKTHEATIMEPVSKKRQVKSPLIAPHKNKIPLRKPRIPAMKIRQYLQTQDGTTLMESNDTIGTQGSLHNECDRQNTVTVLLDGEMHSVQQVLHPEVDEVIDINSDGHEHGVNYSPVYPVGNKRADAGPPIDFIHTATLMHQTTPPQSVKSLTESCPSLSDSFQEDTDGGILPRITGTYSVKSQVVKDEDIDRQVTVNFLPHAEYHENTPKEALQEVHPQNTISKSKISNVKPIRIFSSKTLPIDVKEQQLATHSMELHINEESINTNRCIVTENVHDQMFNKLLAPKCCSRQGSVSQESTVNIAAMLGDHQTSTRIGHLSLNQALDRVKELEKALNIERFGLHRYSGSDEKIKFYTGFRSADTLMRFFWRIEPDDLTSERSNKWKDSIRLATEILHEYESQEDVKGKTVPYMDELFLFLNHVWLGLQPEDLAERFALPSTHYAQFIILKWIYYLQATLPSLAISLKNACASSSKCAKFQGQYSNTRILLHPVEIKGQQKSISNHFCSTRLKSVTGFSPSGEVIFVSDLLPDISSNEDHLLSSNILPLLQRGDGVMFEGEFVKDDVFSSAGVVVHHLPSFDLPHNEAAFQLGLSSNMTADIHRCNREVVRLLSAKYVGSITSFKCFHSVVMYPFASIIQELWKVCCLLVNYQHGHQSL